MHIAILASALKRCGHDVTVCSGSGQVFPQFLEKYAIKHTSVDELQHSINLKNDWKAFKALSVLIKNVQPDLVSLHSSKAGVLGRMAARSCRIPSIFTAHGWSFTQGHRLRRRLFTYFLEQLAASFSPYAIAVSKYDFDLANMWRLRGKAFRCIVHNGVPEMDDSLYAGTQRSSNSNQCVFVMVGRMASPKRFDLLIKATSIARLKQNISVVLVGDGPDREKYQSLVAELGLSEVVALLGNRSDVPEILNQSDVFVLTSNYEGFPMSSIEAMRSGLPVIVSNVGGAAEAVEDGETGFVLQKNDAEELAELMIKLAENPDLRKKMGAKGLERFLERFSATIMVEKTLEAFNNCISNSKLSSE